MRSVGSMYPTEDPLRWQPPSSIKQMCALCVGTVPQEWCNVLKLEIHFFSSSIKVSIQMFYHGLQASLHLCFAVIRSVTQINLSVHLPACPPSRTICVCSHPHTHSFFPISNEMRRSLVRGCLRPLIPNISRLCLHLKRVVGGWQRGNSLRD